MHAMFAAMLGGTSMDEVLIGGAAMIVSAVFGSIYTSWSNHRSQMKLLEKQIELNKEMHKQLMEEQQAFAQRMEHDRRNYERSQDFAKEARQRQQGS